MPATATSPLEIVRAVTGVERSRGASPVDAVAGVIPSVVVEPASVEEAAAVLKECSSKGLTVVPRGGGTKLDWGAPPERADVVMSTSRMDGVLEHAAGDLVLRAQAGCRLDSVQDRLAASGQVLALDPPGRGATLGGVTATAASGPHRLRYGTPRDLLIGITVVLSDGTVARAGGKVVKNVAGYDLGKVFAGSFGTLGLIVEVTFRLHPRPEAVWAVDVDVREPEAALGAVRMATAPPLDPAAVELTWPATDGAGTVTAVFEGTEPGARAQAERLTSVLGHPTSRGVGEPTLREDGLPPEPASRRPGGGGMRIKIAHPPAALARAVTAAWDASAAGGLPIRLSAHAATGVTYVDVELDAGGEPGSVPVGPRGPAAIRGLLGALRGFAAATGGSAVVLDAPADLRAALEVWGPAGDALPLMRRVKERFDPTRTMSPGRFVGGI